ICKLLIFKVLCFFSLVFLWYLTCRIFFCNLNHESNGGGDQTKSWKTTFKKQGTGQGIPTLRKGSGLT
ncbi:hypothetical protein AB1K50_16395, partial [Vibrio cholerae]